MNIAVACPVALQCSIIHIVSIFCACTWIYRLLQIGALKNYSAISILVYFDTQVQNFHGGIYLEQNC